MLRLVHLCALTFGIVGVTGSPSCANHCTQSEQPAQASAFCSAYEKTGVKTSTSYPNIVKTPAECCVLCAAVATPTRKSLPPFKEPEQSAAAQTTPAPTAPACLGTHTAKACQCLSITSSTSTLTYSSTITMTGPFYAGVHGDLDPGRYLKKVERNENVQLGFIDTPSNPPAGAVKLWLDQFGRLFDSDPPTVPFSVPNVTNAQSGASVGASPEQVDNPSAGNANYVSITCTTSDIDCPLICTAPGYGNYTYPRDTSTQSWQCRNKWYISFSQPPNCTDLELFVSPTQDYHKGE